MDVKQAYDAWSSQYDTNENKTRDLEAQVLRACLHDVFFESCLEVGCGTGKNTEWLATRAKKVTAVDLSTEMLAKAKGKISSSHVQFIQADINHKWTFREGLYDLVSFSLVLEHIEHLDQIFQEAAAALVSGGYVYIGELHPFKQYTGSKARFETENGQQIVSCYDHHVSDFVQAAKKNGFVVADINEYFDNNDRTTIPRIISIMLKKPQNNYTN